jgi:hypothetical protein
MNKAQKPRYSHCCSHSSQAFRFCMYNEAYNICLQRKSETQGTHYIDTSLIIRCQHQHNNKIITNSARCTKLINQYNVYTLQPKKNQDLFQLMKQYIFNVPLSSNSYGIRAMLYIYIYIYRERERERERERDLVSWKEYTCNVWKTGYKVFNRPMKYNIVQWFVSNAVKAWRWRKPAGTSCRSNVYNENM